jgi:uncharacterized membrane protein YozB (DUF420 family)
MIHYLPHVDASLNAVATTLLITGYVLIKNGRVQAHKRTMLTCFGVSIVFLTCYLIYHFNEPSKPFPQVGYPSWVRYGYFALLASHVVLAALVPWMAIATIYLGLRDRRVAHRRLARWTFPIWLYVSITGVAVYLILYWLCPPIEVVA